MLNLCLLCLELLGLGFLWFEVPIVKVPIVKISIVV